MPPAVDDAQGTDRPPPSAEPPLRRRRSRRRLVLAAIGALVLLAVVWTVVVGLLAEHRLRAVRDDLSRLTQQTALDRATVERDLARDLRTVRSSSALLDQPGPRLVGWLPIIGRNVDAERVVSDASAAALRAGLTLTQSTSGLDNGNGGVDVARLSAAGRALGAESAALRAPLQRLADQSVGWTLPTAQDGMRQARDQLLGLDDRLA